MAEVVGLVASVVTLCSLAGQSYQKIYNFQHKLKNAPAEIGLLVEEARILGILLQELQHTVEETKNEEYLTPALLHLWIEKERGLREDLTAFVEFVRGLEKSLTRHSADPTHTWGRLKKIISEDRVRAFQKKFATHIRTLNHIELRLQG
jgi:hypothetical protein